MGGLGNQLFQLAAAFQQCTLSKKDLVLLTDTVHPTTQTHSQQNYASTIFKRFQSKRTSTRPHLVSETQMNNGHFPNWVLLGYFQKSLQASAEFINCLCIGSPVLDLQKDVFVHVRGGDYKNKPEYDYGPSKLKEQYTESKEKFAKGTRFRLFTNDAIQAQEVLQIFQIFPDLIVDSEPDEVQVLRRMASCGGGICIGSTFSWWAAYIGSLNVDQGIWTLPDPFLPRLNDLQNFDLPIFTKVAIK